MDMGMGWQPDNGRSVMKMSNAWQLLCFANVMNPILSLDALDYAKLSSSSSSSSSRIND